jgi:uncharacterized lipoprotein YmbA
MRAKRETVMLKWVMIACVLGLAGCGVPLVPFV